MLSNHSVQHLNERLEYLNASFEKYPNFQKSIVEDLQKIKAMKKEALARVSVGIDVTDNAMAYIDNDCLYVVGKPSGWSLDYVEVAEGKKCSVCYDGGSKWYGSLEFTKTVIKLKS
jgi:hypothetical protein